MRFHIKRRESLGGARNAIGDVRGTGSNVLGRVRGLAGSAGRSGAHVAVRLPRTWGSLRFGAESTVTSLQKVPDSELGLLAAASAGLGVGLGIAGAPRLASFAGFLGASILGFAMVSRPGHRGHLAARS
jgi:hypothetical protein